MFPHENNTGPDSVPGDPSPRTAVVPADAPCLLYADRGVRRRLVLSAEMPRVVIGRSPQADVALTSDPTGSRLHAVVEWADGHWTIVDGGLFLNGTRVNGRRLSGRRRLRPGDHIRIGTSFVNYHAPNPPGKSIPAARPTHHCTRSPTRNGDPRHPVPPVHTPPALRVSGVELADRRRVAPVRSHRQNAPARLVHQVRCRGPTAESETSPARRARPP